VIFKLAQKYRAATQDPSQTTITNLYLSEEEYLSLASLDAQQIVKQRYEYPDQGRQYSIDVFEGALTGLILAEIECETAEEAVQLPFPDFALRDVTIDPFFAGGALAALDHEAFQTGLAERLNAVDPSVYPKF
jgi:CYTH domain-containing protein